MMKSSAKLFNKKRSQEDLLQINDDKQEMEKYDTNKIFEEFKKHLFKQDKKQKYKNFTMDNAYKDLICSVRKNNAEKKQKLSKLTSIFETIKLNSDTLRSKSIVKTIDNFKTYRQDSKCQKPEQFVESRVNSVESYCKFKPIRPMTTGNKFRFNSGSKSKLLENRTQSRLISQVSRFFSPNGNSFSNSDFSHRKSQIMTFQNSAQKSLPEISQSIMMVQQQEIKLQQEIASLSQSMNKLTKELASIKKQVQIQERNQKKYKHISNLTTSIKNQTQYIKQQNQKGLITMIERQDETISNLKKFKMNLRKEKDEMESDYIEGINKFLKIQEEKNANKYKQMLFMATYMPNDKSNNQKNLQQFVDLIVEEKAHKQKGLKFQLIKKYNSTNEKKNQTHQSPRNALSNIRLMKKLIDELDNIIELFKEKQPSFETIKQQQCTRVRLCRISKDLLPKPRVQILQKIEQFQQKYDMKIMSVSNLMMRIYHLLTDENEKLEADCLKLTQSKEEANVELKKIMQKHEMELESQFNEDKLWSEELMRQKRMNSLIKRNSWVFLKIIEGLYNILLKYRHMFSLALTLDVDKKQFRETVIQIDYLFSQGLLSGFGMQKVIPNGNQRNSAINQYWLKESLKEKGINERYIRELIDIMFNDHRVGLMIKKTWIESYLAMIPLSMVGKETQILQIIETIHNDCSQIYQRKLPTISSLFLTCFKSLQMTKYESKLAASSSQCGQIFLPNRPVKRLLDPEFIIDENNQSNEKQHEDASLQNSKKKIIYVSETSTTQEDILQNNPTKIIFNLESMKNRSQKKFKALNFSCSRKAYKHNEAIIIPNFNMIEKSEDI